MEKYLVIILLILLMFAVYQCWNLVTVTKEGFAEVPTNVDTNSSIKTLADLAVDLQSGGGLKVPGNLSVLGGASVTGALTVGPTTGAGYINDAKGIARLTWLLDSDTIINTNVNKGWQFNDTTGKPSGVSIDMTGKISAGTVYSANVFAYNPAGWFFNMGELVLQLQAKVAALEAQSAKLREDLDNRTKFTIASNSYTPKGIVGGPWWVPCTGGTMAMVKMFN